MIAATIGLAGIALGSMSVSIVATRWDHRWIAIAGALNTLFALAGIALATEVL